MLKDWVLTGCVFLPSVKFARKFFANIVVKQTHTHELVHELGRWGGEDTDSVGCKNWRGSYTTKRKTQPVVLVVLWK